MIAAPRGLAGRLSLAAWLAVLVPIALAAIVVMAGQAIGRRLAPRHPNREV